MTTSRLQPNYYTSDEFTYENNNNNNTTQYVPQENYSHIIENSRGVITSKTRDGTYNVVEKDFGDHKVIYHVPIEYGDDYDISILDDIPSDDQLKRLKQDSPKLLRRRIIEQYNDFDDTDDYEYVEEIQAPRRVFVSPRRSRDTQVVTRVYESEPPTQTVEYVYEDDYADDHDYRIQNQEEVEYIVRDRTPKQVYVEEPPPPRRTVYVRDPSIPVSSPRPPPPPPAPPVSYSPRRSPHYPSSHPGVTQRSPSPALTRPNRRKETPPPALTRPNRRKETPPPASTRKKQPARSLPIYEPPVKPSIQKANEQPLRLMDIVAQNRAKRGTRIPKPRREVDEERVYDPPTYHRNVIKNGFIVHK